MHNKGCNCEACQTRREEDFAELEVRTLAIALQGGSEASGIPILTVHDEAIVSIAEVHAQLRKMPAPPLPLLVSEFQLPATRGDLAKTLPRCRDCEHFLPNEPHHPCAFTIADPSSPVFADADASTFPCFLQRD